MTSIIWKLGRGWSRLRNWGWPSPSVFLTSTRTCWKGSSLQAPSSRSCCKLRCDILSLFFYLSHRFPIFYGLRPPFIEKLYITKLLVIVIMVDLKTYSNYTIIYNMIIEFNFRLIVMLNNGYVDNDNCKVFRCLLNLVREAWYQDCWLCYPVKL